jgi:hypothetical protein
VKASRWTTVTTDNKAVTNLISLYLLWEYTTSRIFDENYFIKELISRRKEYYLSLLVNAILAIVTVRKNGSVRKKKECRLINRYLQLNYRAIIPEYISELSVLFYKETECL